MLKLVYDNGNPCSDKPKEKKKIPMPSEGFSHEDELKAISILEHIKSQMEYMNTSIKTYNSYILGSRMSDAMAEAIMVAAFEIHKKAHDLAQIHRKRTQS